MKTPWQLSDVAVAGAVISGLCGLVSHEMQANTDRWLGFLLYGIILGVVSVTFVIRENKP